MFLLERPDIVSRLTGGMRMEEPVMNKTYWNRALIGVAGAFVTVTMMPASAQAQSASGAPVTVGASQSLLGATGGNGISQSKPVASVDGGGRPLIGVGALSGKQDHYGSAASVSVLNSARLVGVDGPGGAGSSTSISVQNPTSKPVLAPR
jgi:hypothetical protein